MSQKCVTVVAGIKHDLSFCHIYHVAETLSKALPNFHFKGISKDRSEWKPWLREICSKHNWCHTKSPLIWREIGVSGSKATYIGGAYQFWEFIHEYYDLNFDLTEEELEKLRSDLLYLFEVERKVAVVKLKAERRRITLIGAGRSLCPDLVPQLITMKELWLSHGVVVNLYDEPGRFFKIKRLIKDVEIIGGGLRAARVVRTVADGLKDCDILIYLDELKREEYEGTYSWLQRNYNTMEKLSVEINQYAPPYMKIIFCSMGPTCFYANILKEFVKKISENNIVVVCAHYGLEILYSFVNSLGFSVEGFGCPPVWGFLGINHFVDVCHMVQRYDVYKPNKRALKNIKGTTLPLGTKRPALRWFSEIAQDKNPYETYLQRKAIALYRGGRTGDFQKCRAICDFLKLWYSEEKVGDEIISLGISSDSTFGMPKGLYFSQPVYLNAMENGARVWTPFNSFPMPSIPETMFQNLISTAEHFVKHFLSPPVEECSSEEFEIE